MTTSASLSTEPERVLREALAALEGPDADAMLATVEGALRKAPADFRLWHVHGLIERAADRRQEALASLQRALQLAPSSAIVAHGLARTLFEAGLPSVDAYGRALALAPGDAAIIAGMTSALFAAGQGDAAIRGLEQIMRRSPLWIEGHKLLSDLRWMNGEREGFARSFDDARGEHPLDYGLWSGAILALGQAEQWERLLTVIAEGRAAKGEMPLFAVNEAICHAEMGDRTVADRLFAPFADSEDAGVQVRRVRHLLRSGRADEASLLIDAWITRPEAAVFWPYASLAWRLTGDPRWRWLEGDERLVGVYDIADRLPPLDVLARKLGDLHQARGQPLEQSVRGGTQTDGNLFHHIDPTIVALRESVRSVVADHAAALPARDPDHPLLRAPRAPIAFNGAWSVRLRAGGNHANHVHPMGWLSSALYVALPSDLGRDEAGWLTIGEPQAQLCLDLPALRTIEPRPGRLVLFPSYMWHGTKPFHDGERLTVAFDVATPRGAEKTSS